MYIITITDLFDFFNVASSKNTVGNVEGKTQFNCGVVPEATGLNVPISAKEKVY